MNGLVEQLERFLDDLPAGDGFVYGARERLAVSELLLKLWDRGEFPENPKGWMTLLAPLMCGNKEQQSEFYRRFEEWAATDASPVVWLAGSELAEEPAARPVLWPFFAALAAFIVMVAAGIAGWYRAPLELPAAPRVSMPMPPIASGPTIPVAGRVVSESGAPLKDVEVWVPGDHKPTGPDGRFQLSTARRDGSTPLLVSSADYPSRMLQIDASKGVADREVKLRQSGPAQVVSSDVIDKVGGPVTGPSIQNPIETEFSPDGKLAITHGRTDAVLWDSATGREIATGLPLETAFSRSDIPRIGDPNQGARMVARVGLSPDHTYSAQLGSDGLVHIRESATGRSVADLGVGVLDRSYQLVTFSPNQIYAASGGNDGNARIFDATGHLLSQFPTHSPIATLQFDPPSRYLAVRTTTGTFALLTAATGQLISKQENIHGAGFTRDNRLLLASHDLSRQQSLQPYRWLGAAPPFIALALLWLWLYRRRAHLRRFSLPLELDTRSMQAPDPPRPFQSPALRKRALEMRQRKPAQTRDLAIHQTLLATIRRGGFRTPIFAPRTMQREHLILIQQSSIGDQQAALYRDLCTALKSQNVYHDIVEFPSSPEGMIEELAATHPHHDLWIVADPATLLDPFTLQLPRWLTELSRWEDRAILSPVPVDAWVRDLLEAQGFRLDDAQATLPDSIEFPEPLRHLPLRWVERRPPPAAEWDAMLPQLEKFLKPDGMLLLSACAVYPELSWKLTLWLAGALAAERRDEVLARLVSLPWFRYGFLPDWMRVRLLNGLTPEMEAQVRPPVEDFLLNISKAEDGKGDLRFAGGDKKVKGRPLKEYVMMEFLLGLKPDERFVVNPPSWLQKLLYEGGHFVFGFGWRVGMHVAVAVALAVLGWSAASWMVSSVPSRVMLNAWKLPGPPGQQSGKSAVLPTDPFLRAMVAVAQSQLDESVSAGSLRLWTAPFAASITGLATLLAGNYQAGSGFVPGALLGDGVVESVDGSNAVVIQPLGGKIQRVSRSIGDGLPYVWIPPGKFTMGCSEGDTECNEDEKPAHEVTLTRGFWMTQTPVTVGAWKRYTNATRRKMPVEPTFNLGWANDQQPVVNISWDDSKAFCSWAGKRLPTEAEYEYAARAGNQAARYGSLDDIAWYADNSGKSRIDSDALYKADSKTYYQKLIDNGNGAKLVGLKAPNAFKLYDMLGNVFVWTADWYGDKYYTASAARDPAGPRSGGSRVVRGGSWNGNARYVRASDRSRVEPSVLYFDVGVRCVGEIP